MFLGFHLSAGKGGGGGGGGVNSSLIANFGNFESFNK